MDIKIYRKFFIYACCTTLMQINSQMKNIGIFYVKNNTGFRQSAPSMYLHFSVGKCQDKLTCQNQ